MIYCDCDCPGCEMFHGDPPVEEPAGWKPPQAKVWIVTIDYGEIVDGAFASETGANDRVRVLGGGSSIGIVECEVDP